MMSGAKSIGISRSSDRAGGALSALLRLVLLAVLIAATVLIFRPPTLPEVVEMSVPVSETALWSDLVEASETQSSGLTISWAVVNGLIESRVESAQIEGMRILPVEFVRVFAIPDGDAVEILLERSLFGFSLVSSLIVRPVPNASGEQSLAIESSALGSLPIPAGIAPFVNSSIINLIPAFEPELDVLSRAQSIQVLPEGLRVSFAGK